MNLVRTLGAIGAGVLLLACGGTVNHGSGQDTSQAKPRPNLSKYEPSLFDRCPVLRSCFGQASDYDSCPKTLAAFDSASTKITARTVKLLTALVAELKQVDAIAQLQLTGVALRTEPPYVGDARAKAVKEWLVARGVSPTLLATDSVVGNGDIGHVGFVPRQCSGSRDGDEETDPAALLILF